MRKNIFRSNSFLRRRIFAYISQESLPCLYLCVPYRSECRDKMLSVIPQTLCGSSDTFNHFSAPRTAEGIMTNQEESIFLLLATVFETSNHIIFSVIYRAHKSMSWDHCSCLKTNWHYFVLIKLSCQCMIYQAEQLKHAIGLRNPWNEAKYCQGICLR